MGVRARMSPRGHNDVAHVGFEVEAGEQRNEVGVECEQRAHEADPQGSRDASGHRTIGVSKDPGITAAAYLSKHIGEHLAASMDTVRRLPFVARGFGLIGGLLGARARPKLRLPAG